MCTEATTNIRLQHSSRIECLTRFTIENNVNNAPIITNLIQKFPISDIFVEKKIIFLQIYWIKYIYIIVHIIDILNFDSQSISPSSPVICYIHLLLIFNDVSSILYISIDGSNNKKSVNWKFHFPNSRPRIHWFFATDGVNIFTKVMGKGFYIDTHNDIIFLVGNLFSVKKI